jgi:hypothetical protein
MSRWGTGGRCVGLKTLPPLFVDCLEIREPQPPGTLRACKRIGLPLPLPLVGRRGQTKAGRKNN